MSRDNLKNTENVLDIRRQAKEHLEEATRLLTLAEELENKETLDTKITQKTKKSDPIADALAGRLKHKDIVEYGYRIKDDKQVSLKWSYLKIDGEKYFVCKDIIGEMSYSKNENNNWEKSDLKKALDENTFKLYSDTKLPLGKDDRIDNGVNILSLDQYQKVRKDLPLTDCLYWLCSPRCVDGNTAYYVDVDGHIYDEYVIDLGGVRPAFCLKSEG